MEDLVFIGVVVGAVALAGLATAVAFRSQRARRRALQERVQARGWRWATGDGAAWAVEGQAHDLPWRLEVRTRRNRNTGRRTYTVLEWPLPSTGATAVGPKLPSMVDAVDLGNPLVQRLLVQVLGPGAELLATARRQPISDSAIVERYDLLATDDGVPQAFLRPEVQHALLAYAQRHPPLVVTWWQDRLTLRLEGQPTGPEHLERLVDTGAAIVEHLVDEATGRPG